MTTQHNNIEVKPIRPVKSDLRKYVKFGIDLYKGNDCFVPPLVWDAVNTLIPGKNPSLEHCSLQSFLAYRDGEIVGRITAIINNSANEKYGEKTLRFGFMDFIDDNAVVDALFDAAIAWGKERGMNKIVGPMGFNDLDQEGMLIEGFNEMGTMATIYNYPYYQKHMERLAFEKEVDWIEFRMTVPDKVPDKIARIADIVTRKFDLHIVPLKDRKVVKQKYGQPLFNLINECYKDLFGYVELTSTEIDYYVDMYLGLLRLDDVCVIADNQDKIIGVGITMPSLSKALRSCGGKLFPFGWYNLLRAIKGNSDVVDLLLVAIAPEYQGKGVNALLFNHLIPAFIKHGYKYAESNVELEGNDNVQKQWEYFERRQHRRRRAWTKKI
jgi:GNAT superfamily N-acetyltransferase